MIRLLSFGVVLIVVHFLTLAGAIPMAAMILVGALIFIWAAAIQRNAARRRSKLMIFAVVSFVAAVIFIGLPYVDAQVLLVAPPFLGYMLASAVFAQSLLPKNEAVITRMCRIVHGNPLPEGLDEYSRIITWGWAILPGFLAVTTLFILAAFGLQAWSWASNVANPILLIAFYVGEHIYRGLRLPHLGKPSFNQSVKVMFDPVLWR